MIDESGEGMDIIGDLRVDFTARMRTKSLGSLTCGRELRSFDKILLSRALTT
jgi:hypothetical protein